ncbi:transposase [Dictyobacter sp. S3.2.2.5]|uniref:Transposase n=1 Tax=Dictyobacter halimunensis TaxID=3026934 RepID=A0ABQ6FH00_9CHLR|nr:transposase [Dictyobacter sp. S3.2.2.5]
MSGWETSSPFLPLPDDICISSIRPTTTELIVSIACTKTYAHCPRCGARSERVHGHYVRTVADLPCGGRRVILKLSVRKFVCGAAICEQTIFTERLAELVQSYARMTNRLRQALIALGLATSAEVCERVAPSLSIQVSASTLLRRLREVACPPPVSVRVLGIDDWCWKRGQTYGTLLVDLERRLPIELLPDRQEETVTAWLLAHPEIEVISRDRAGAYAAAAKKGAPQAQQIADRYHVLKNLQDALKDLIARKQKYLPEIEETLSDAVPASARGKRRPASSSSDALALEQGKPFRNMSASPHKDAREAALPSPEKLRSQVSRTNRCALYGTVRALHTQGCSERVIAQRLGIARQTVHRYLSAETFPERATPPPKGSLLDPYKPAILTLWQQECYNGTQIYHQVLSLGYTGSESLFRQFIGLLRKRHQAAQTPSQLQPAESAREAASPTLPKRRLSCRQATWLCLSQPHKLTEEQKHQVALLCGAHPDLEKAYQLSQAFVSMLAERREKDLDAWLQLSESSGLAELKGFAQGIRRDYAAVRAAFTSSWSNGPVESQVNCLKLQKRLMFGRAKFDLLRLHVLRRA